MSKCSYVSQCGHAGLHTQSICCAEKKQPMHGREWVTSSWCRSLPPGLPVSAIKYVDVNGWWLVVGVAWLKESGGFENCRTRLVDPCTIFRFSDFQISETELSRSTERLACILFKSAREWTSTVADQELDEVISDAPPVCKANNIINFSVVKQWQAQGIQVSQ